MSLAKKLQREVQANPAKAGALGVLLLVASYFWAPLVMGFFKSADSPVAVEPAVAQPPGVSAPVPTLGQAGPQAATDATPTYDWRKHSQLADEDPLMHPDAALPGDRDPFASRQVTAPEPEKPVEAKPVVVQHLTPADVGLVLGTTLLSARKKIAEIGGKSYTIGDRIEVSDGGGNTSFEILEIEPRRVVLRSDGKRYELTIPRPLVDSAADATISRANEQKTADTADEPDEPVEEAK